MANPLRDGCDELTVLMFINVEFAVFKAQFAGVFVPFGLKSDVICMVIPLF